MGFFSRLRTLGKRVVETGRKIVYDITRRITGRQTNKSSAANKLPAARPLEYKPINKPLEREIFDYSKNRGVTDAYMGKDFEYKRDVQARDYSRTTNEAYFGRGETGIEKRISKATSDKEGVLTDITPEQAQIFWQATRRAWEGKDASKRYEYIREYFGGASIADIFDYIMDKNKEAIEMGKNKPVSTGDNILVQGETRYAHRVPAHLSMVDVIDVSNDKIKQDFLDWLEDRQ